MRPITTYLVLVCMGVYGLLLLFDLIRKRRIKRSVVEITLLVSAAILLHLTTGFPEPERLQAFGGGFGPLAMISVLFLCVLLGMAAHYFFYLKDRFSWSSFLKPLCVSPIVLLPLLGTLQGVSNVEPVQVASFALLAFQNGFFWKVIFERASKQV